MSSYMETARLLKSEENPRDNQILQRMLVVDGFSPIGFEGGPHLYHIGKANFEHHPILDHYGTVTTEREAVWLSARTTPDSWMFIVAPTATKDEHAIRAALAAENGGIVRVTTENVYLAGSIDRTVTGKENTLKELVKLEKERQEYNKDTPVELRQLLVELADEIGWKKFNEAQPYLHQIYREDDTVLCQAYITFRSDGMTHEEAEIAVSSLTA